VEIDEADDLEDEVAGGLEGFGADFVEGVLGGVMVAVGEFLGVGAVVVVDEVEDGDAALLEGEMVVLDGEGWVFGDGGEMIGILRGGHQDVGEPGCGVLFAVDVERLVADHVEDDEGLDFGDGAVLGPLGGEMACAVEGVGGAPGLDGLFTVIEDEPDAIALGRIGAEVFAQLDEHGGGAGPVVGSDEVYVLEGVVGLVVGGEDDDSVLLAGIAHDVVAHGDGADGGVGGGEAVGLEVAVGDFRGEVRFDELFGGGVAGRAAPALGGCGEELFGEVVGGLAVEARGGGFWRLREGAYRSGKDKNKQRQKQVLRLALRAALRMTHHS